MAGNGKNGKNGRRRRRWIWTFVMLVVVCGAFFGIKAAFKPNHQIDPSKLAKIERGDIARSVVATGKIQPRSKVEVKSKASGIVKKLMVDYGEFVRQGQVLAELDKEELQAQVREAKAILLAARAFRASELFAGIVLLGAIGFVSNALLALAVRRLLRWQHP